eukprot:767136-Hanusia_phi.AAC.6
MAFDRACIGQEVSFDLNEEAACSGVDWLTMVRFTYYGPCHCMNECILRTNTLVEQCCVSSSQSPSHELTWASQSFVVVFCPCRMYVHRDRSRLMDDDPF